MKPQTHPLTAANFFKMALVALLFVIGSGQALPQSPQPSGVRSREVPVLTSLDSITIRLSDPDSLPVMRTENIFGQFEVIDERPDTTRIGIHSGFKGLHSSNKQLVFPRPAREEIISWLNQHFARPGAPYTALIVLRNMWLSDANYTRDDLVKDQNRLTEKTRIWVKAEVYAVKDGAYTPIFRYDSAHVSGKNSYHIWGIDLAGMLDELADSASLLTSRKTGSGRSLRLEDIRQFNASRFSTPISTDTALVRGVYASFEEFKANNPSVRDFEIEKVKDQRLLYVKEAGGASYYSHNAWGYCDGKDIFIMKDGVLRPVWREGRAYYFFSEADKEKSTRNGHDYDPYYPIPPGFGNGSGSGAVGSLAAGTVTSTFLKSPGSGKIRIFTVDMDSGDVY